MATISLYDLFPEGVDGKRTPLPKQHEFLTKALDMNGPKYIRYCGGIGAGKSLIGCITMLAWGVQYPGTYLIARQYYPELKDTTYQTFLDICPEELIVEHRIADKIVKIRSQGGVATFLFRPLEEPDKLRSLNLNAFHIDEGNQVSEHAFTLLQGRLRGKYVRKGILTQNSGGHDWSWRWFVRKDMMTTQAAKDAFYNIVAPSTENVNLPDGYVQMMMETWDDQRIKREIMADEDTFEGQIYPEFRDDVHVIPPFRIPDHWTKVVGADHGYRNPASWLWGAVDQDDNLYIYREFYEREWNVDEIMLGKKDERGRRVPNQPGTIKQTGDEALEGVWIDPGTNQQHGNKGGTIFQQYVDLAPPEWGFLLANNKVDAGIDRVKQFLKVDPKTKKPRLFIFRSCPNLIDEMQTYKYEPLPSAKQGHANEKEKPKKVHDHACDALRYLLMSRPEPNPEDADYYDRNKIDYHSLEGRLHRDLQVAKQKTSPTLNDEDF